MTDIATPELITMIISNFPNFIGFIVLAYVLYRFVGEIHERYDRLLDMYHRLVSTLAENRVISSRQEMFLTCANEGDTGVEGKGQSR